jgi:hypothetical protein
MVPAAKYRQSWQELRRRQRLAIISFVAFLPIAFCSGMLSEYFHRDWIFIAGGGLSFVLVLGSGIYHQIFTCPHCDHWFFVASSPRVSWRWLFGRACAHCGRHIFSDPAEQT